MASGEENTYCDLLTPVICRNCEGQDAINNYCLQCHANICDECKLTHCDANLTRDHIILHRTHREVVKARRSKKVFCSHHTGREYVTYCMICSTPCCATCITEKHNGHTFSDLDDMISKTESQVDTLIKTVEIDFIPVTEHVTSTMEEEINSYKKTFDKNKQYAKDTIQQLRQNLDHTEETLLAAIDDRGRKDLNMMESAKRDLENKIKEVKSLVERGKIAPVNASLLFLKEELSTVHVLRPNQITFPGNFCFSSTRFGSLPAFDFISSLSNGAEKVLFDASTQLQHNEKEKFHYQENVKVIKTIDKIQGRSVLNHSDHHVWIYDYIEQHIDIYNDNLTKVKTIKIGSMCYDMAKYGLDDVLITDLYHILRISITSRTAIFCSTHPLSPIGICVNNKQQIVVGGVITERGEQTYKIVVYSSYGSSIHQEIEKDQYGEPMFRGRINRVRQTVNGDYVVAVSEWVKCLDTKWNVNWTCEFGKEVLALCCNKNNNILVGDDDKNEIVMMNKDGHRLRTLLTKNDYVCMSLSMDVDSKGRLWIQQSNWPMAEGMQYSDLLTLTFCDSCGDENDITNYCLQCHANICYKCRSTHCDTRLYRDHIVLYQTHPEVVKARRNKKVYCLQHVGKEYVIYCRSCELPCCALCIIEDHNGHEFADLEKKITETVAEVDELVHVLESDLIPLSEKALSTLAAEITLYEKRIDNIKRSAKLRIHKLRQQLDETERKFITEVDNLKEKDLIIMKTKKLAVEENLEKVKSVASKGKVTPVDASLLFMKDELIKVNSLRPNQLTSPGNLSFTMSPFQLPPSFDIIGTISQGADKILFDASTQVQTDIIYRANVEYPTNVKVVKTNDKIKGSSILHYNDQCWIFDANERRICIYNDNFININRINLYFTCSDMAMYSPQAVVATDWTNKNIVKISSSGSITKLCSTAPMRPCGICVNNKQQIVVGLVGVGGVGVGGGVVGGLNRKIVVYSSDGSSVLQETSSRDRLFTGWIYRVRQAMSGEYIVADGCRIMCLSTEWTIKWTYEFGLVNAVWALYCDKYNNILVGDFDNDKVVIINKDGELIRTLLTKQDGICKPMSIDVDSKGQLWIGQEKNVLISTHKK